jgi:hypothetical protein
MFPLMQAPPLRRLIVAAAVLSAALSASAQNASKKKSPGGFSTKFIGEGGSYQQPSSAVGDYLETGSRQQGGDGTFGRTIEEKAPSRPEPARAESGPEKPVEPPVDTAPRTITVKDAPAAPTPHPAKKE